jgi:hypothetical protein
MGMLYEYDGMYMEDNMKKYFNYLESLRDSGETNMWGAAPFLSQEFDLSYKQATYVLVEWIKSFQK